MRRRFENQLLDSMQCDGQDCNMKRKKNPEKNFLFLREERFLTGPIMVFGDRLLDALC